MTANLIWMKIVFVNRQN